MKEKLELAWQLIRNMGFRYVVFRLKYEVSKRLGWFKKKFPIQLDFEETCTLQQWQTGETHQFFFQSRADLKFPKTPSENLATAYNRIMAGDLLFFNTTYFHLGKNYDWLTNPDTGFKYDIGQHWTEISDFSDQAGDIKFVWEKSRFIYLHTIMRYDYHFDTDSSAFVFKEIETWLAANPLNQGPNYFCSQETSLRLMNWIFALHFYRDSEHLTAPLFQKIMASIRGQLHHVRQNIDFSRIAVRNNHALTETLMLYLSGLIFPFFPETKRWSAEGKRWFEQEIDYQVYADGTFLQFSHNYYRVVVQLMTWALYLSERNGDTLAPAVHNKAQKMLNYLYQSIAEENGFVPNQGSDDGSIFFPLNNASYFDYRPQLNALNFFFTRKMLFKNAASQEDTHWFSALLDAQKPADANFKLNFETLSSFPEGGYETIRDGNSLSFIKCGGYTDRPAHADNLHLDVWVEGENWLRDGGVYKYNTDAEKMKFFNGTASHNTLMLGNEDQMKIGPRFIWLSWSQKVYSCLQRAPNKFTFEGKVQVFKQLGKDIFHTRRIEKTKNALAWRIDDHLAHKTGLPIHQIWNINPRFVEKIDIETRDENNQIVQGVWRDAYFSPVYNCIEECPQLVFTTNSKKLTTHIKLRTV
jgi:hypothetical protein